MTAYVLDTSVAVAWYLPERFSDAAKRCERTTTPWVVRLGPLVEPV